MSNFSLTVFLSSNLAARNKVFKEGCTYCYYYLESGETDLLFDLSSIETFKSTYESVGGDSIYIYFTRDLRPTSMFSFCSFYGESRRNGEESGDKLRFGFGDAKSKSVDYEWSFY